MNLLIVDDEPLSVDSIAASLPWESIGIDSVYKAYSMAQAVEVFEHYTINILLCDIEMPKGSGIDLMEWIRKQGYEPVCIFLTCFSNFDYASKAVKLQMFDYILKPCEYTKLRNVLERAVQKANTDLDKSRKALLGKYWNDSQDSRIEHFWKSLLTGEISTNDSSFVRELERRHLNNEPFIHQDYYLLLLQTIPDLEVQEWEGNTWQYPIANVISELMHTATVLSSEQSFTAVIPVSFYSNQESFYNACNSLIIKLQQLLPAEFLGFCAPACPLPKIYATLTTLQKEARHKFALQSTVFFSGQTYHPKPLPAFSEERWQNALLAGNSDIILDDLQYYLSAVGPNQYIDRMLLNHIYYHLLHTLYSVVQAHNLDIQNSIYLKDGQLPEKIFSSVSSFLIWIQEITEEVLNMITEKESSATVVEQVKKYIHEHLDNPLNRAELTKIAHLHPDYLSTVFRKNTGVSLSEYVTRERIQEATKLLLSTDLPIVEIAIRTGFQTISYFTKQFKRIKGVTPTQYRREKGTSQLTF